MNPLDVYRYIDNLDLERDYKAHTDYGARYYYYLPNGITVEVMYSSIYGNSYELISADRTRLFSSETELIGRHRVFIFDKPELWAEHLKAASLGRNYDK